MALDHLAAGIEHHRAGRLAAAEEAYRLALRENAANADAANLLGVVTRQLGRLCESEQFIRQAIQISPLDPRYSFNLGETRRAFGNFTGAVQAYEASLQLNPRNGPAWHALGLAKQNVGDGAGAIESFHRAIAESPGLGQAHEALFDFLWRQERFDEAASAWHAASSFAPDTAVRQVQLGALLLRDGNPAAAIDAYRRAAATSPKWAEPYIGLADSFARMGNPAEAERAARVALSIEPANARAMMSLGVSLNRQGNGARALEALQEAVISDPLQPLAHSNLATLLADRFDHENALDSARKAVELAPKSAGIHSNLLLLLNLIDGADDAQIYAEHLHWAAKHAVPRSNQPRLRARPMRPIVVGYVSPDMRRHPVASFFESLLAGHHRDEFRAIVYSDAPVEDEVTRRLRACVATSDWRHTAFLNDDQLYRLIEQDAPDILVDLAGHTAGNRLAVFGRGVAPVQVTYLGYPNTTGIDRSIMHYRLTDARCDPPGHAEEIHSEQLVRLPDCFVCFRPDPASPEVALPPSSVTDAVTFGSFCGMLKITRAMIRLWSELLAQVPASRLLLKNRTANEPRMAMRLRDALLSHGISGERIILAGHDSSPVEHLRHYANVDVALDTFPYNGTTTTCEALWMGVPVITLVGTAHRSRVGLSLLSAVGMERWATYSSSEYINAAAALAADANERALLRKNLRERVAASALTDSARFVTHVEAAFRQMVQAAREA